MSTERDILPAHEREAARAALVELETRYGGQTAVSVKVGISQGTVNRAILYGKIGPSVMRLLLEHLQLDIRGLVERYGDPSALPAREGGASMPTPPRPKTIKEEAVAAGVLYGGGIREDEVRAIADRFEPILEGQPIIAWIETVLREIQRTYVRPALEAKAAKRAQKSEQRVVRKLGAAKNAGGAPAPVVGANEGAKKAAR